jgi:succinate dehydrogenase / fumarate reductase cytochrome b subunit
MKTLYRFYDSTVGKKIIMGVTGLVGVGFVIGHMAGNLQAFIGQAKFDEYAAMLHGPLHELLMVARVVLVVSVVLHIVMAVQLYRRAQAARPVGYQVHQRQASTWASRTMRLGGVFLLVFLVLHLGHFTWGWTALNPAFHPGAAYWNLIEGMRQPWALPVYLAAMAFLAMHLYHGAWAAFRTLGVAKPTPTPLKRTVVALLAAVVAGGFALVPLAVAAGFLK